MLKKFQNYLESPDGSKRETLSAKQSSSENVYVYQYVYVWMNIYTILISITHKLVLTIVCQRLFFR